VCPHGKYSSYAQGSRNACSTCQAPWRVVDGGSRCAAPGTPPSNTPTCPCNKHFTTAAPQFDWSLRPTKP
jgi:hypothetical protein